MCSGTTSLAVKFVDRTNTRCSPRLSTGAETLDHVKRVEHVQQTLLSVLANVSLLSLTLHQSNIFFSTMVCGSYRSELTKESLTKGSLIIPHVLKRT